MCCTSKWLEWPETMNQMHSVALRTGKSDLVIKSSTNFGISKAVHI